MLRRRRVIPTVVLALLAAVGAVEAAPAAGAAAAVGAPAPRSAAVAATAADYVPVTPARLLDTRPGHRTVDHRFVGSGAVPGGTSVTVQATGRGGIPAAGVGAVVVNVTGIMPTVGTYLTAYPAGATVPEASTLNVPGSAVFANAAVVKIGTAGSISVFNGAGRADVAVDVVGYYPQGPAFTGSAPQRLMDTRPGGRTVDGQAGGGGRLAAGETRELQVTGRAAVPTSGVDAVMLNVTGILPSAGTYLSVFPAGAPRPTASTVNPGAGEIVANLVVAKVGAGGRVSIYNAAAATDVAVDVTGWVPSGTSFVPMTPIRFADTRLVGPAVAAGAPRPVTVAGRFGVPATARALVVNLTAVQPGQSTYVTAYPAGSARPDTSTLNLPGGAVRANLAVVALGNGRLDLANALGSTHLVVDVVGYFDGGPAAVPTSLEARSDQLAAEIHRLINLERASRGIAPLARSHQIDSVATLWSGHLAQTGTFWHNPDYSRQLPTGWSAAGENIVMSSESGRTVPQMAQRLVQLWVGSPGHFANLTSSSFTHTGVGAGWAPSCGCWYATQNFGGYRGAGPG